MFSFIVTCVVVCLHSLVFLSFSIYQLLWKSKQFLNGTPSFSKLFILLKSSLICLNNHVILLQLQQYPGWGNARDIIAMWKIILEQRASRVVDAPEKQKTITESDTEQAVNKMVADRKPKGDQSTIKRKQEEEKMQKIKGQQNQMSIFFTICSFM